MATTPRGGGKVSRQRGTGCAAGRARRPRRAARRGRPCAHGDVPGTRAAGDVGPYHKCPRGRHAPVPPRRGNGMRRLVGRDVLGAPRAGGRARCAHGDVHARAHGDVPGTRAAGDVGPYHKRPRGRHAPVPPRRGGGMRRLVGRDVLGAPRAGDVHAARTGTSMPRAWGRPGGRGPPGTSAPTTNVPVTAMRPCRPGGGPGCAAGRARRPRRAARRGTSMRVRGRSGDAGRRGRRPLPQTPRGRHAPVPPRRGNGMRRLVGRDVLGAPCAGERPRRAHGDAHARTGTSMPRAWGRPGGRGPPGTSAPTTNAPVTAMRPCRPGGGPGCADW